MNILINGIQSSQGGGAVLLDNLITYLRSQKLEETYICLVPNEQVWDSDDQLKIQYISLPTWLERNIFYPFVNKIIISQIIKKYSINIVFNFSDIPIPSLCTQIFVFDWSYAAYPESLVWKKMDWFSYIIRRFKLYYFKKYFSYIDHLICQTEEMERCLKKYYSFDHWNTSIIPSNFSIRHNEKKLSARTVKIPRSFNLFYPAVYYPHKNIEICIPLARLIKERKEDMHIILTLEESQHPKVKNFFKLVFNEGLEDVIINVGYLSTAEVAQVFQQCNALFMPTLLESFGIVYLEAMFHQKLILTSNLGFATAVCKNAALYFDPNDPYDILATIEQSQENSDLVYEKIKEGKKILLSLPTTSEVQEQYISVIRQYAQESHK